MNNKELPIGTVVLLKGGLKKVMITGYSSISEEGSDKVYDYNGCIFPEGLMENVFCLFDASQIEEVFFKGLENDEFKDNLEERKTILSGGNVGRLVDVGSGQNKDTTPTIGRRRTEPKHPRSKSEMLAKYGVKRKSNVPGVNLEEDTGE